MSSRKKGRRRFKNKHHRRTNSDILSIKDAKILKAILNSQHHQQQQPIPPQQKQYNQEGSLNSTLESIDHIFSTTSICACNKFVIYDILCVIIAFSQMLFYYYLIGQFANSSYIFFIVSCTILLTSRFIWSLYLSHYMKHKIIPYLVFYCIIVTDFVLPIFLLFKYFATDLYSSKSLNYAIRSQLFIVCIPMSIIQVIDMTLNQNISLISCISISVMIILIAMEFWTVIRHALTIKIRIFHLLSLLLDIFKFYIQIHVVTCLVSGISLVSSFNTFSNVLWPILIHLFGSIVVIKTLLVTPVLAIIILTATHFEKLGWEPYIRGVSFRIHINYGWYVSLWRLFAQHCEYERFEMFRQKLDAYIVHPLLFAFIHICSFFYLWIGLEILCWSSFWFIFHSHWKNMFGVHAHKLKYILSFLLQSVNSFDYKTRLYCLHYILYDGYGWWQRKDYYWHIEHVLQKYVDKSQNVEQGFKIAQFTPPDKKYIDEISHNVKFMISHLLQHVMKIINAHYDELWPPTKRQQYLIYVFYGFNVYTSLISPFVLLIYCMTSNLLLCKLLCGYFGGLLVMSYFMFEYYKYLHAVWHCSLINFQYPIQIESLAPFYEYIHTYYGRIELIKSYFGSLADIMIRLLGLNENKLAKLIVRDGIKYASEHQVLGKEFVDFAECKKVVLNRQVNKKIYPDFNLYLFDE